MADLKKLQIPSILVLLLLISEIGTTETASKEELVQSESKDGKLEIIKQIKKVNDDGSYTIGYEADDGSFKIESRDVLGHIKGTYGYIDDAGQIKRVSYSTSNSSEVLPKPESSVVQRIPKTNRTYTTRRPTTYSTASTSNAIQRISKLRSSTTEKPNYSDVVSMEGELTKTTKPQLVFATSTPRVLLQGRPILRSTPATPIIKSEGQIARPEIATARPTELPLFRRLALKHAILGDKPVTEEPEERSNILRRQLSQEKTSNFDPQQHVFTLQQSLGSDSTDVYSASVTTGTPRPLFTTTAPTRGFLSSTTARPTIRYPSNYQRNALQDLESSTQTSTTTDSSVSDTTPTPVPVVQIPANRASPEQLVAIKHPFQQGHILVPLSQLQGQLVQVPQQNRDENEYVDANEQYIRETTPKPTPSEAEQQPVYVRRAPPQQFRPIPVHVDQNGYIREVQSQPNAPPTPYPLPVPVTPPKFINNDVDNDIEHIDPPVSTKDFQRLLQQLIVRQTRLERINELTDPRRHPEYYQPRYRPIYRPTPVPYYVQRVPETQQRGPMHFAPPEQQYRQNPYIEGVRPRQDQEIYNQNPQSYAPTRRVARLLQNPEPEVNEQFLPPDVREMLLLRMLQLAINPALPLNEEEIAEPTTSVPQYKKVPVRNVEILGEEMEEKRPLKSKRYRQEQRMNYYEQ